MGVLKPELIFQSIIPIIMAGILGIYGLIVSVILQQKSKLAIRLSFAENLPFTRSSWSRAQLSYSPTRYLQVLWWLQAPRLRTLLRSLIPRKSYLSFANVAFRLPVLLSESLVTLVLEPTLNSLPSSSEWFWSSSSQKPSVCMDSLSLLSSPSELSQLSRFLIQISSNYSNKFIQTLSFS